MKTEKKKNRKEGPVMKKSLRIILFCCCLALCAALFAVTALAVPAAPHSGREGAEAACRSDRRALVTLDDIPAARHTPEKGKAFAPSLSQITKDIPLVTIVIGFNNVPYNDAYNWNRTLFSGEKSITSYYSDMSFGKFTFVPVKETSAYGRDGNTNRADKANDGVIHVKLSSDHIDWATDYSSSNPKKDRAQYLSLTRALIDAVNTAGEYMDFSAYDADGSGTIENNEMALAFVVAGYEGAYLESYESVGAEKVLWAHASGLVDMIEGYEFELSAPSPDGVVVSDYIAMAEELEPGMQQTINTLAHELGHYLGLPDLYDTDYLANAPWSQYTVGTTSAMCDTWGFDPETDGYVPYSFDVWSRYVLGWVDPVTADATGVYSVNSQSYTKKDAFSAVMIPTQKEGEYYLLENRQGNKWDAGMATTFEGASRIYGIMLWHIDETVIEQYFDLNAVNNSIHHPGIMPLFPEEEKGVVKFTGTGDVYNGNPFFDKTFCLDKLEMASAVIDLPLYGTGGMQEQRLARFGSGVTVEFLGDSAASMQVRVDRENEVQLSGGADECMYCHRVHQGFFGRFIAFIHRLLYVLQTLFKR